MNEAKTYQKNIGETVGGTYTLYLPVEFSKTIPRNCSFSLDLTLELDAGMSVNFKKSFNLCWWKSSESNKYIRRRGVLVGLENALFCKYACPTTNVMKSKNAISFS